MYSIFGKDLRTGKDISEELEKEYVNWILEKYWYASYENQDEFITNLTKEFNIKRYVYEMGSNRSIDTMKEIFAMEFSHMQQDKIYSQIGEPVSDNDKWVSAVKITELISCLYRSEPSLNVIVMHPEINGSTVERTRLR